jgi:hypothetical protein
MKIKQPTEIRKVLEFDSRPTELGVIDFNKPFTGKLIDKYSTEYTLNNALLESVIEEHGIFGINVLVTFVEQGETEVDWFV